MGSVAKFKLPCPSRADAPLSDFTTFGMGGKVPLLVEPRDVAEFAAAVGVLKKEGVPFRVLGGGANVLIDDRGLDEIVVLTKAVARVVREGEGVNVLRLGAGVSIPGFVVKCREMSLTGAECMVGIPGTIGGATVMNAGGRHGWFSSIARRVRFIDADGKEQEIAADDKTFAYRHSIFGDCVVLETVVELKPGDAKQVQEATKTILKEKQAAQPLTEKSAGCIFKNPPADQGGSAGKVLEAAGVKGMSVGDAVVSPKHANFIVNKGAAKFRDVMELIERMKKAVFEKQGVRLETEVKVWAHEAG